MSWIKMTTGLARAPEVISISLSTGLDEFAIIGRLHAIWCWLDEQTEDGKLAGVSIEIVDRLVNFPGFGAAMSKAGWLCEDSGVLIAPNFGKHNGSTAKQRANSGVRMSKLRTRRNGSVTEENEGDAPGVPRGEERREEKNNSAGNGSTPRDESRPKNEFFSSPEGIMKDIDKTTAKIAAFRKSFKFDKNAANPGPRPKFQQEWDDLQGVLKLQQDKLHVVVTKSLKEAALNA